MRRILLVAAALPLAAAAQAAETVIYDYDARGRLVAVARSGGVNHGATTTYAYDRADNRTGMTTSGVPACLGAVPVGTAVRIIPIRPCNDA